jgi:hypothetical protein
MGTLIVTLIAMLFVALALSLSVLVGRKPITGSCVALAKRWVSRTMSVHSAVAMRQSVQLKNCKTGKLKKPYQFLMMQPSPSGNSFIDFC